MKAPLVSVVMPVYNSQNFLSEAIESILNQSYEAFEFLIYDDASTDSSVDIIKNYARKDSRIIPTFSDVNKGYVHHLNESVEASRGKYIIRMDSDDVSMYDRIEVQVSYLEEHPHVGVIGSSAIVIDDGGETKGILSKPEASNVLKWICFFKSPFIHPAVCIRKELFDRVGLYDLEKMPAEDYDLWCRTTPYYELVNISKPLIKYRSHANSMSKIQKEKQVDKSIEILRNHWNIHLDTQLQYLTARFFKLFHIGEELDADVCPREIFHLLTSLYDKFTLKHYLNAKDARWIRNDLVSKLYYLVVISRRRSYSIAIRLLARLLWRSPRSIIRISIQHFK